MQHKPKLSFGQIWNMSFGFLGIQFGFALQNANVSRIFQTLGGEVDNIAFYWLAAPVTGLLVQPIIGYFSDRTWHPTLGRRRPYFLLGAILACISLVLMPNSPNLAIGMLSSLYIAIGILWIMDTAFNVAMEPFRAFVGDMLPSEQRTQGFAMQSFFIGIGAIIASALPYIFTNWFGMSNTAAEGQLPPSVIWSFYAGAAAFVLAVGWTVFSTKEYPPEDMNAFLAEKEATKGIGHAFKGIFQGIFEMPKTMIQLAGVQFFAWFALFAMWIYTTSGVTSHIYGTTDTASQLYNDGADWVGMLFAMYNGVAAIAAIGLPFLAAKTSRRFTHFVCLLIGGLGLISMYFISDPNLLLVSMIGVGIAWASILSMPYAMLAGALPEDRMGYFMGVFNFFIVIPQIVAAGILGFILKMAFNNEPIYALIVGGGSMILAGVLSLLVDDDD